MVSIWWWWHWYPLVGQVLYVGCSEKGMRGFAVHPYYIAVHPYLFCGIKVKK